MGRIILKRGRVIDPARKRNGVIDLLIEGGVFTSFAEFKKGDNKSGDVIVDCQGQLVVPGLIDMHTHFRYPGLTEKEDLESGGKAAIAGGFTTVLCMANTKPVIDEKELFAQVSQEMSRIQGVNLHQVSALTYDLAGERNVDLYWMENHGALAFSDDGKGIKNIALLVEAARHCALTNRVLIIHCEEAMLSGNGVVAAGPIADELGVEGMPKLTEVVQVYLGIKVSQATHCHVHFQHLSCAESVALVRNAKKQGLKITAETCPHYLSLTTLDVKRLLANAKMNPPLRGPADRKALRQGIMDGTIDVIATDHAPHTPEEKSRGLRESPFGVIGLESAVPVVMTAFSKALEKDEIGYEDLIAAMTINPAKILGLDAMEKGRKGMMELGYPADVTVIDPKKRKKVDSSKFYSKARNCPWDGKRLEGWPVMTIRNGIIVMKDGQVLG